MLNGEERLEHVLFIAAHMCHSGHIPPDNVQRLHILLSTFKPVLQQLHNTVYELAVYHLRLRAGERAVQSNSVELNLIHDCLFYVFPSIFVARIILNVGLTFLPLSQRLDVLGCTVVGFVFIQEMKTIQ